MRINTPSVSVKALSVLLVSRPPCTSIEVPLYAVLWPLTLPCPGLDLEVRVRDELGGER